MTVVKESQNVENAHAKRLDRDCKGEAEKKQKVLAESREVHQFARRRLEEGESSLNEP